jgi:Reverse transcriptase (RNA-dependent DNA polymerase)
METFFDRAVTNVSRHGDTDIFPFPVENHIFFDMRSKTVKLLSELHGNFDAWLASYPPAHEGALAPVSYTGFRWATQLDPFWNLYFLSLVLSIADQIEAARIPVNERCVFSYRYAWDEDQATIFDHKQNWRSFMERSLEQATNHSHVVICDISEFYSRVGHHRLENAMAHLKLPTDHIPQRIRRFLSQFSGTNSFGLPVGGPAARLLSELALNQVDHLLRLQGIPFCRYSDDFHIFASSIEDAYSKLLFLAERLQGTQGLQLQKSKTRIMSSAEFIATSPLRSEQETGPLRDPEAQPDLAERAGSLFRLSLRFDPYSPTKEEDYEALRRELERIDIVGLLQTELMKSRIHVALARKIISVIKYLAPKQRDDAVLSLLENAELLYPAISSILIVTREVFTELSAEAQTSVAERLIRMISKRSYILGTDIALAYAVRVISAFPSESTQATLAKLYGNSDHGPIVRRDVILAMTKLNAWHWLSDRRTSFRSMSPPERRAFIIASFFLQDEGDHWRRHTFREWTPFERLAKDWMDERVKQPDWTVPL